MEAATITFGEITLPVHYSIYQVVDDVKALSRAQLEAIIRSAGLPVSEGAPEDLAQSVLYTAMSIVQEAWYIERVRQSSSVPEEQKRISDGQAHASKGHEARITRYRTLVERFQPREPKAPKAKREPADATKLLGGAGRINNRPVSSRVSDRRYGLAAAIPEGYAATLRGFKKATFEALVFFGAEARLTIQEIIERAKEAGTAYGGKDGGLNQTQYQLKLLSEDGVIVVTGSGSEAATPPAAPATEAETAPT
jgi:hypothetical protein